jgi:2-polyprenyl-6-methoxyphenol hydroxylase-like FAD-dependent oxidoreductase
MGTSLALAGAYNLAGALAHYPDDIATAFTQYDEMQRPLVEPAQAISPVLIGLLFGGDKPLQVWLISRFVALTAWFGPLFKLLLVFIGPGKKTPPVLREHGFAER